MKHRVNIGCGRTPTDGWLNFDNTPAIRLAASPVKYRIAKFLGLLSSVQIENIEWNKANKIGFADATKQIPLENSSTECIYTSHMFEHLSREGGKAFLIEAFRVLDDKGVLRISVPDLQLAIEGYQKEKDADRFMEGILVSAPPFRTLKQKVVLLLSGYRHHQWMYDGASLAKLMVEYGFSNVTIQQAGMTLIENPVGLDLHERSDISVYVEGVK